MKFILKDLVDRREEGIRTLDTLSGHTHFPGVLLQPLGHLSLRVLHVSQGDK